MQQKINVLGTVIICCLLFACKPAAKVSQSKSLLVFSATKGYRHESIEDGIAAIRKIAVAKNWTVVATEDSAYFTTDNLKNFSGIVFLNTTGDVLGEPGQQALVDYVHNGGGIAGIHAATDCEYNWPWYNKLMGAYFESHPAQQTATLKVVGKHPATAMLPANWSRKDEWYNFRSVSPDITVLLMLDETTYKDGKMGANHPSAWYHSFEGGKVFYTALGHTRESYTEPLFLEHITAGITSVLK
ncbi:ThuA domain-containing protein [Flavihumibacter fluvii]|uniref:ThuA domain-containing protein n=1 Tax=Flavihumibacter fluvii TaxID=2838157 RepID=UPI001BDF2472|nr:ThuA domain-containing protein [Flavihumibacter fluvii]ULQ54540.1 ThuA domain-containing protein [Flavihumibacter fluvii]